VILHLKKLTVPYTFHLFFLILLIFHSTKLGGGRDTPFIYIPVVRRSGSQLVLLRGLKVRLTFLHDLLDSIADIQVPSPPLRLPSRNDRDFEVISRKRSNSDVARSGRSSRSICSISRSPPLHTPRLHPLLLNNRSLHTPRSHAHATLS